MKHYPMLFKVKAESKSGMQTTWATTTAEPSQSVTVAIPPEFDGPGGGLSPEDLYAMALQNCFIATFKVFAEKSKVVFEDIQVQTQLDVDRNEKGAPWMARIHLQVRLSGAQQQENAKRLLEKTSHSCMILNSVQTAKSFEFQIN